MSSEIEGPSPPTFSAREIVAQAIALTCVVIATAVPWLPPAWRSFDPEALCPLVGLVAVLCLCDGRGERLGLGVSPRQGWLYWLRVSIWCGAIIAMACVAMVAIAMACDWPLNLPRMEPRRAGPMLLWMCVRAPLVEEVLYRSLLLFAIRPLLGTTGSVIVSGVWFASVHVAWGVASPDNQVAGFLLAWAYVRSGSLAVPLAMHAGGNLFAWAAQLGNWLLFPVQ
jgi:membrane protease YdiL (CAAX protease family)